jgi:ammonium transporter, Amt family
VQTYGMLATVAFTLTACALVFLGIKYTIGLRLTEEQELAGQDLSEHGMFGYPERFIDVPGATPEEPGVGAASPAASGPTPTTEPSGSTQ